MFIVPGKFVFCHWPRTGGTWFRKTVESQTPIIRPGDHLTASEIPVEFRYLPRVGIVRDPVTWIESLFTHRQHTGWREDGRDVDDCRADTVWEFVENLIRVHPQLMMQFADGFATGFEFLISHERLVDESRSVLAGFALDVADTCKVNGSRFLPDSHRLGGTVADAWRINNATYCEQFGYPLPEGDVFEFSAAYSGWWRTTISELLLPRLRGRPVSMLEVGVCEGGGACVAFDWLLAHPESRYIGCDVWKWNPRHRAERNISRHSGGRHLLRNERWLRNSEVFDVIVIDGDHSRDGCTSDLVATWDHLRSGGFLVVDDYGANEWPTEYPGVRMAVDEFLDAKPHTVLRENYYQRVAQKL